MVLASGGQWSLMLSRLPGIYYGWWIATLASGIEFANASTAISILTIIVIPTSEEFGWNRTKVAGTTSRWAILGASLAPLSAGWWIKLVLARC